MMLKKPSSALGGTQPEEITNHDEDCLSTAGLGGSDCEVTEEAIPSQGQGQAKSKAKAQGKGKAKIKAKPTFKQQMSGLKDLSDLHEKPLKGEEEEEEEEEDTEDTGRDRTKARILFQVMDII